MLEPINKKECFVLMPIEDLYPGYKPGHFKKVYEYLIKPSVISAGYIPVRGDELPGFRDIEMEVIEKLINAPLVICDISALNPKVITGLGVRRWYGKPIIILKDAKTLNTYPTKGHSYIEYPNTHEYGEIVNMQKKLLASIRSIKTA